MLTIMLLIVLGIVIGFLFRKTASLFTVSNFISAFSVYLLLFFMGISTAVKKELFENFKIIGAQSILLCIVGILGSIVALIPVGFYLKRHRSYLWSYLELKSNENSDEANEDFIPEQSPNLSVSNYIPEKKERLITKDMFYPIICFVLGFFFSIYFLPEKQDWMDKMVTWSLYILIFFTGIGIGRQNAFELIKKYHVFVILIPLIAMFGSMLFSLLISLVSKTLNPVNSLAIASGMGYYSISAIITGQNLGEIVGVTALFTNLLRELLTMLFAPLMVKMFGPLAPIGSGGATAMDTTLPFIKKSSGNEYAIIGFISGVILTILVPVVTSVFH